MGTRTRLHRLGLATRVWWTLDLDSKDLTQTFGWVDLTPALVLSDLGKKPHTIIVLEGSPIDPFILVYPSNSHSFYIHVGASIARDGGLIISNNGQLVTNSVPCYCRSKVEVTIHQFAIKVVTYWITHLSERRWRRICMAGTLFVIEDLKVWSGWHGDNLIWFCQQVGIESMI